MLRDQTTRSKPAAREHNGGAGSSRSPSLEISNPVLIVATAVVGLIAQSMAATGMGILT
jgi:hypothetical protein